MKALHKSKYLFFLFIGVGFTGMLLRAALYTLGTDQRGLIGNYHPLQLVCLLLAAAMAAYAVIALRKDKGSNEYAYNFPPNRNAVIFAVLVPIWFLSNGFTALESAKDRFDTVRAILAFLSVPCLAWSGVCRFRGKRVPFALHGIVCLFFAMDMICRYRVWSGNPQLVDYVFQLLACVFLTLTAYYRTAFDVELGSRRILRFCSLMAVLMCMFAFAGPESIQFYIGGFLFALSGICPTAPKKASEGKEES